MGDRPWILIVDSDEAFTTPLQASLCNEGRTVVVAASAERAMAALRGRSFDVMLTNLSHPEPEALRFVARVKKVAPTITIVVMATDVERFPYEAAMEAGADDFIRKPFTAKELVYRLKQVIHHQHLRRISLTDELTGLFNRRGFYTLAEQQLKLARRQKQGIHMLYADVDDLKDINDRWGHSEGDRALIDAANLLKQTYRDSDVIARLGGDEFVVIPIGSTGDNMPAITGRLMKNLEAFNAQPRQRPYLLGISIGTSYYDPANPCAIEELLGAGDRAMYEDKSRKGR